MKKFKFKLEKVLKIRENRQEEMQILLAKAQDKRDAAVLELQQVRNHRDNISAKLEYFKEHPMGIEDLLIYQGYLDTLDVKVSHHLIKIQKLEEEVIKAREMLLQASKEKKMLESVRTKQKSRFNYELMRAENDFFDEIGTIRSARKLLKEKEERQK